MAKADLTVERLREMLHYDPETGRFAWAMSPGRKLKSGEAAGWDGGLGRKIITLDKRNYKAHRLAWLYVYGSWPNGVVDHINGDPSDNSIANLRDVSQAENSQNVRRARCNSGSGLLGAFFDKRRNTWFAAIRVDYKLRYLGKFSDAEGAHKAYLAAKRKLHPGCTI